MHWKFDQSLLTLFKVWIFLLSYFSSYCLIILYLLLIFVLYRVGYCRFRGNLLLFFLYTLCRHLLYWIYILGFFFINLFLFIYFWLCWVFVAARGLSPVAVSRGYSLLRCACFSLRWLLLLPSMGSRHVGFCSCGSWALETRLSSCGARA